MANRKDRICKVRPQLEKGVGAKFKEMLPVKDKIAIMEHLLEMPYSELQRWMDEKKPTFVVLLTDMLIRKEMEPFMAIYAIIKAEMQK
jgi:hypothetical protein